MYRRTYEEIVEMLLHTVLDTGVAGDILRRSGWRLGQGTEDLEALMPPGGDPGDQLWFMEPDTLTSPVWFKPNYLSAVEAGMPPELARPWLGDDKPVALYTFGARNPDYLATASSFDRNGTVEAAREGERREELLVWEDVPEGFWYYPFNVDWFITKRELGARAGQYLPRQIKLRGCVAEGAPDAELQFCYATNEAGPWTSLVSTDLVSGGAVNSGWVSFNESAAGDVYLGLFLNARSSISRLHMGAIEVLMRWTPRGPLNPQEFLP